jgi:hypothetical protein
VLVEQHEQISEVWLDFPCCCLPKKSTGTIRSSADRPSQWALNPLEEAVAVRILTDLRAPYRKDFSGFSLTRFDGTTITI